MTTTERSLLPDSAADYLEIYKVYKDWFLERGVAILRAAGARAALIEMATEIRTEYPDVILKLEPVVTITHGVVSIGLGYNFARPLEEGSLEPHHSAILVMARVATKEITVPTNNGIIVLSEEQYNVPGELRLALNQARQFPIMAGFIAGIPEATEDVRIAA